MRRVAYFCAMSLTLAACASPYIGADTGRINRPVSTVWVGADKFVYVPGRRGENFEFERAKSGAIIAPGMMYTDGGSIPRFAQIFKGFSAWGFGPAYIVHDWIFYARHCYLDRFEVDKPPFNDAQRFADVYDFSDESKTAFHDSATALAEVIKTIVDNGQVRPQNVPATLISSAVDSVFALALWNETGACDRQRVEPLDIAIVWVRFNGGKEPIPDTWKLSPSEIKAARANLAKAREMVRSLRFNKPKSQLVAQNRTD